MKALLLPAWTGLAVNLHPLKNLIGTERPDLNKNPLPRLFILGEQKCGTSSLFSALRDHPDVCDGVKLEGDFSGKDLRYFDTNATVEDMVSGLPRYLQHFERCPPSQLRMEATPEYLTRNMTAQNIKNVYGSLGEDLSELRFIVILRDPVKRMMSAYQHKLQRHIWPEGWTIDDEVQEGMDKFHEWLLHSNPGEHYSTPFADTVKRGLYDHTIGFWLNEFEPAQFKILTLKQLAHDGSEVMNAIHEFIGVSPRKADIRQTRVWPKRAINLPVPEGLTKFYEPHVKALFELKEQFPIAFHDPPENPFSFAK
uniref:Sulfotransferase domain-containing protein n=1 Tax=Lotharella globosa TaxID=91324 RepID=A0A7S3Z9Y7_9EUKA|mmetsp:Transcript_10098/g.19423  ORF Transcript_10098/g.19423 Transcript_10098/m.19423 type:complete len:310 (+) Transcript_10098:145-1074(+)